jgi:hypothetical protein
MALYKVDKMTQEGRFIFIFLRIWNPHTEKTRNSTFPAEKSHV